MPTNKRKSLEDLTPITDGSDAVFNHPILKVIDPTGVTSYQDHLIGMIELQIL